MLLHNLQRHIEIHSMHHSPHMPAMPESKLHEQTRFHVRHASLLVVDPITSACPCNARQGGPQVRISLPSLSHQPGPCSSFGFVDHHA